MKKYLSAADLGLSERDYNSLIIVQKGLESGQFVHSPIEPDLVDERGHEPITDIPGFSMQTWRCGTVGCIAGWVGVVNFLGEFPSGNFKEMLHKGIGAEFWPFHGGNSGLSDLFWAKGSGLDVKDTGVITTGMAARAIKNYLLTGDPKWATVVNNGK